MRLSLLGRPVGRHVLMLVGLTALAAALRFATLGEQSFWFDETATRWLVGLSPGKLVGALPQVESTPPLYYMVAWAWVRVFGRDEVGLRSLSALAGTATVPIAYHAAAALASRRTGLIAAALTAVNPLLVWYSQEGRAYALVLALGGLSFVFFARALGEGRRGDVVWWALASALAVATHYFAAFIVVPEALWLLAVRRRRDVGLAAAGVAAVGAALLPLALAQRSTGNTAWIAGIRLPVRLEQIPFEYLAGFSARVGTPLAWLAAVLAAGGVALVLLRGAAAERRAAWTAMAIGALALAIPLVLALAGVDDVLTRNLILAWLPLAVALAIGLGTQRAPRAGGALAAGLCVLGAGLSVAVPLEPSLQRPNWRAVAAALGPARIERAILIRRYTHAWPLEIDLSRVARLRDAGARVREIDVVDTQSPRARQCWWGAACDLPRVRPSRRPPARGFVMTGEWRVGEFTIVRFRSRRALAVTPGELTRRDPVTKPSAILLQRPARPA